MGCIFLFFPRPRHFPTPSPPLLSMKLALALVAVVALAAAPARGEWGVWGRGGGRGADPGERGGTREKPSSLAACDADSKQKTRGRAWAAWAPARTATQRVCQPCAGPREGRKGRGGEGGGTRRERARQLSTPSARSGARPKKQNAPRRGAVPPPAFPAHAVAPSELPRRAQWGGGGRSGAG